MPWIEDKFSIKLNLHPFIVVRERKRDREKETDRQRGSVCVCVCVGSVQCRSAGLMKGIVALTNSTTCDDPKYPLC